MAIFKPSAQLGRCDECRVLFDPVYGGACAQCRRLLCATHLHGGLMRRIVARFIVKRSTVCVACRSGEIKAAKS